MTKERLTQGRLTPSQAVHRRQVIAEERRKPDNFEIVLLERGQAERRFRQVQHLLNSHGVGLNKLAEKEKLSLDQARLSLEIEDIWLRFRLDYLSQADRQSLLDDKLKTLKEGSPELFAWLTAPDENEKTLLVKIRDKAIPPITIGGFHAKRRRKI